MAIDYPFRWSFRVNSPVGWRQRVGYWLRLQAARIDGLHSLGVEVISEPALSRRQQREAITFGMECAKQGVAKEVEIESLERMLEVARPDLYQAPHG